MLFIGIDLAWSDKNSSGIAILEGNKNKAKLISNKILFSDKEILDYVKTNIKNKNAFIAIDAPLIAPNQKGRRLAEKKVGDLFRKYDAGAHPTNRKRLSQWSGKIRGEEIVKLFKNEGFIHNPYIKKFENKRKLFEVYPHPSMIVLFNLKKILPYKAKPKRGYNLRWKAFKEYQKHLKNIKPLLIFPKGILKKGVNKLKGKKLKDYEDMLDAIFCAYIAYYGWINPHKCAVLGNMKKGYILTPIFDFMKEKNG
ncbi:MAG: DUF429 domain-containing protein [Nanoarchaeota archaeon]